MVVIGGDGGCTRETIEFTANILNLKVRSQWAANEESCKRPLSTYANATYPSSLSKKAILCWDMFCEESFDPQPLPDMEVVTPVEIP